MLVRESWEKHCTNLPPGSKVRVGHDCGGGKVLLVSNTHEGYSAWCFRCGDSGFIPHPAPSLSERLAALALAREAESAAVASPGLPQPMNTTPYEGGGWPLAARVWLYKAGLSNDDIHKLGAYYHEPTRRVVLPVYHEGEVVYWQARSVDGSSPKYLNPGNTKPGTVASYGDGPVLVLTEDILSAFRVGRVTAAWSLLGTSMGVPVLRRVLADSRPVVLMLDPDTAGRNAANKISRQLRAVGYEHYVASPARDPKYFTREETISCINNSLPQPLWL